MVIYRKKLHINSKRHESVPAKCFQMQGTYSHLQRSNTEKKFCFGAIQKPLQYVSYFSVHTFVCVKILKHLRFEHRFRSLKHLVKRIFSQERLFVMTKHLKKISKLYSCLWKKSEINLMEPDTSFASLHPLERSTPVTPVNEQIKSERSTAFLKFDHVHKKLERVVRLSKLNRKMYIFAALLCDRITGCVGLRQMIFFRGRISSNSNTNANKNNKSINNKDYNDTAFVSPLIRPRRFSIHQYLMTWATLLGLAMPFKFCAIDPKRALNMLCQLILSMVEAVVN